MNMKKKILVFAALIFSIIAFEKTHSQSNLKEVIPVPPELMGNRFVTFGIPIRTTPWEVSRDVKIINEDEEKYHTLKVVQDMRETFAKACPEGRLTWAFSLNALEDQRKNFKQIRDYVAKCHYKYGDEITYGPCNFPAFYLPRARINKEMKEAIDLISKLVGGGYRPQSVLAGFLSSENLKFLADSLDIHVAHANIWSQHAVDAGGADGSISYPYYPSLEHFCKPAQDKTDFVDCVNLDGWSVDFLNAMVSGGVVGTTPYNQSGSRRGVGPIETYCEWGLEIGQLSVMHTEEIHFNEGFKLNGFGYVPTIWEAALLKRPERIHSSYDNLLKFLTTFITETKKKWPDVKFVSFGEFGEIWRNQYKENSFDYRFVEKGLGIGSSWGDEEIRWFMNKDFRLALLHNWHKKTPELVVDFTRYDLPAHEPTDPSPEHPVTDWSLMNVINQKGLRPQDNPIPLTELKPKDKALINKHYPEVFN